MPVLQHWTDPLARALDALATIHAAPVLGHHVDPVQPVGPEAVLAEQRLEVTPAGSEPEDSHWGTSAARGRSGPTAAAQPTAMSEGEPAGVPSASGELDGPRRPAVRDGQGLLRHPRGSGSAGPHAPAVRDRSGANVQLRPPAVLAADRRARADRRVPGVAEPSVTPA